MDSFRLHSDPSSEDKQNPDSQFLIFPLSPPTFDFIQISPFPKPPSNSNPNLRFLEIVREVQKSIVSNVEKCMEMLKNLRSQNEITDKVVPFSYYLQNCCQLPRINKCNLAMPSGSNFAAILPGDSVVGTVVTDGVLSFLNIYNMLLVTRLVLTWFPNAPPAIVTPIRTVCDPYLHAFRGIIPPLGGLDFSPVLAFLVLNAFTSTAVALPAELPSSEVSEDDNIFPKTASQLTTSETKRMRRFSRNQSGRSNGKL